MEAPFKTLQHAIDALEYHLVAAFNDGDTSVQGLVYAMPGLYGPGAGGNGEVLPVRMRDRVNIQGQGARGCVIRGDGTSPPDDYFSPTLTNPGRFSGEILVSYTYSSKFSTNLLLVSLPWAQLEETTEMFDGFTLQGGDVQVLFYREVSPNFIGAPELRGRISNCLFDMRHAWQVQTVQGPLTVNGPYFGIQMAKLYSKPQGYPDQRVLIANNTFLMGEYALSGQTYEVSTLSRPQAVAVVDVTDSGCPTSAIITDRDMRLRGLGSPMLVNNLFRTVPFPGPTQPFALMGIDLSDTLVATAGTATLATNAFASGRVGSSLNGYSNGYYTSAQVVAQVVATGQFPVAPLWDCRTPSATCNFPGPTNPNNCCIAALQPPACSAAADPVPIVEIFDGGPNPSGAAVDPGFVGEYLETLLSAGVARYRDARLLPGSPMIDSGLTPVAASADTLPFLSSAGWLYSEPPCIELRSFDCDHEGFGNSRRSGASIDIGYDEFHSFILAGSYANDSNSHNVSGFLNPTIEPGRPQRILIFGPAAGTATQITVNGVFAKQLPPPAAPPPAWKNPPRTTSVINPLLPFGFQTRYISFSNASTSSSPPMGPAAIMPWVSTGIASTNLIIPWNVNQSVLMFRSSSIQDVESSTGYFGTQAVFHTGDATGDPKAWSNLQYEYR